MFYVFVCRLYSFHKRAAPPTRPLSAMTPTKPPPWSSLHAEREFIPTPFLGSYLNGKRDGGGVAIHLDFFRLPDKAIRDTYYDLEGKLSSHGVWIRKRRSQAIGTNDFSLVPTGQISTKWEAKVRLDGNSFDSQFHELEGEAKIRELLRKYLPGFPLESLPVIADLETHRKTWLIHQPPTRDLSQETNIPCRQTEFRIHIDNVAVPATAPGAHSFRHAVGEVEMTTKVYGVGNEQEREAARKKVSVYMNAELSTFVHYYRALFPMEPKPKGALDAFFEWKQNMLAKEDQLNEGR